MVVLAVITEPEEVRKILRHLVRAWRQSSRTTRAVRGSGCGFIPPIVGSDGVRGVRGGSIQTRVGNGPASARRAVARFSEGLP